jgi:hypothetical protein
MVDLDGKFLQFQEFPGDSSTDFLWFLPVLQVHVIGIDMYLMRGSSKQWSPAAKGFDNG